MSSDIPWAKCSTCRHDVISDGQEWLHAPISHRGLDADVEFGAQLDEHHAAAPHDGRTHEQDEANARAERLGNAKQFFKRFF